MTLASFKHKNIVVLIFFFRNFIIYNLNFKKRLTSQIPPDPTPLQQIESRNADDPPSLAQ